MTVHAYAFCADRNCKQRLIRREAITAVKLLVTLECPTGLPEHTVVEVPSGTKYELWEKGRVLDRGVG